MHVIYNIKKLENCNKSGSLSVMYVHAARNDKIGGFKNIITFPTLLHVSSQVPAHVAAYKNDLPYS